MHYDNKNFDDAIKTLESLKLLSDTVKGKDEYEVKIKDVKMLIEQDNKHNKKFFKKMFKNDNENAK